MGCSDDTVISNSFLYIVMFSAPDFPIIFSQYSDFEHALLLKVSVTRSWVAGWRGGGRYNYIVSDSFTA